MKVFKQAINKMIQARADRLLVEDLAEYENGRYFQGYDSDDVDVGVGRVTVREDILQNEDLAFKDAKNEILEELKAGDFSEVYDLFDDEQVQREFIKLFERF